MYLFVRRARLTGGQTRASMMWAEEITERVNQVTDLGFTLHAQVFSAEVGELVWAATVSDLATLEKGVEKLQVDDFYIAEQDRGHSFMLGPPSDLLQNVVHGEMSEMPLGGYTTAITSVCAEGRMTEAVTAAIAVADRVKKMTGTLPTVSLATTGPYGGITWSTGFPAMASMEAANAAMAADTGWIPFVDATTSGLFTTNPGSSSQAMYRRLR